MKWTTFWDMHSGGGSKEKWDKIYIQAPRPESEVIFYNRFGHNPQRVSCTCCGDDYSIDEHDTLEQATAFHRGCRYAYLKDGKEIPESDGFVIGKGKAPGVWAGYIEEPDTKWSWSKYQPLEEYVKNKNILVIYDKDIIPSDRVGEVPEQGYVWKD